VRSNVSLPIADATRQRFRRHDEGSLRLARQDAAKNAAEEQVAEREQHGASDEVRCDAVFYASGLALGSSEVHLHRPE
jgi:hypothetical protein